jgi:hypothetical protein
MNWFTTSPSAALSPRPWGSRSASHAAATETIRSALLGALAGSANPGARSLSHRIHFAPDAERLWHLRPEAMSVLAVVHGEARAREALAGISTLFQDVLPDGLACKLRTAGPRRSDNLKETA